MSADNNNCIPMTKKHTGYLVTKIKLKSSSPDGKVIFGNSTCYLCGFTAKNSTKNALCDNGVLHICDDAECAEFLIKEADRLATFAIYNKNFLAKKKLKAKNK